MIRRLGFVAIAHSIDAMSNRTCRLRNATPERLRELIAQNLAGLRGVLEFAVARRILLYRITSDVVPFGSHPVNRLPWWREFAAPLRQIGEYVRRHAVRVSMHPGQFTVLNSPSPAIVEASVAELAWHRRFLDALGVNASAKIVLHVGGLYGDKAEAKRRFVAVARTLPAGLRRRLVVENDERLFSAEDVLEVAGALGIPVVFDWLHHTANPGRVRTPADARRVIARCFATWRAADGVPKIHLSSQARGGRLGEHGDWIALRDLQAFLAVAPAAPFDCMLEARQKDRALFRLRRQMCAAGLREQALQAAAKT